MKTLFLFSNLSNTGKFIVAKDLIINSKHCNDIVDSICLKNKYNYYINYYLKNLDEDNLKRKNEQLINLANFMLSKIGEKL